MATRFKAITRYGGLVMLSCHLLCFLGYKPRYPLTRLFDFPP